MQSAEWLKIKEIFYQALDLPKAEREPFLAKQEDSIRSEVSQLIASHEKAEDFIGEPAIADFGLDGKNLIGKNIGGYKILEVIGAGGMGTVFLAEKEGLEKKVALKIVKRGMDTDAVLRRFIRERQILSRLEHPNIARLLDSGATDDGLPFFVMEYVEGLPLTRFCDEHQLDIKERLELFRQICAAVSYSHQNLIIHRDLKPSNILVTKDGTPKLLDFGIAKLLNLDGYEDTATATQGRIFTPEYASPEHLNGLPITTASDVYSLGVILYELLSGQRPFQTKSGNYKEIANAVLTEEPIRPSSVVSKNWSVRKNTNENQTETRGLTKFQNPQSAIRNLKGDLDNIILKSLRKEPERRYQSVQEFAEDLRRYLVGLPVTATADTTFYRFSKFIGRNKIGTTVAAIIVLLASVAVWQSFVATRERQKAEKRLNEIRDVAKSLMNETNDSLGKIPGNVAVQKSLVEKSVLLLDSLAAEETDEAALLVELADAYTKLARIQITSFREFGKAEENLEKSNLIFQRVLLKTPDNVWARLRMHPMFMVYMQSLRNSNRREEMFRTESEAIKNLLELIRIEPEISSHYTDLAAMYVAAGTNRTLFGQTAEAVQSYRQGVEIVEQAIQKQITKADSNDAKAELARIYYIKGVLLDRAGEPSEAVQNHRRSGEIAETVFQSDATQYENFSRIVGNYHQIAEIHEKQRDYDSALDAYLKAKNWVDTGLKRTEIPEYSTLLYFKCYSLTRAAKISEKMVRRSEAQALFAESETACWGHVKQDEDDSGNIYEVLPYFYVIADFYNTSGEKKRAVSHLLELTKKMQNTLEKMPLDFKTAFRLAETLEKIGDFYDGVQQREFYARSSKIWQDYSEQTTLLPEESEKMRRVLLKLENQK